MQYKCYVYYMGHYNTENVYLHTLYMKLYLSYNKFKKWFYCFIIFIYFMYFFVLFIVLTLYYEFFVSVEDFTMQFMDRYYNAVAGHQWVDRGSPFPLSNNLDAMVITDCAI